VPEETAVVNRAMAGDLKVSVSQVANLYQTVLTGTQVGYFREGSDQIPIRVQIKDAEKLGVDGLLDLTVTNADGQAIPLRSFTDFKARTGPQRIQRRNQGRVVRVSGDLTGRDMGSVIADIMDAIRTGPVPEDFSVTPTGDYEEQQKAFRELALSFVLALVLVYMVMACQYESLRDPFVVMFSVPLAAIGVLLTLFLSGTTFNIQSFIGCIMLGGIVVNNAILLVDHTNLLRRRDRMPMREAVLEAGRRRLRPILMTSLTTMLGLLPLALGLGEGGEAQAPMARAVIGGLASSGLITLLFIPAVYVIFEGVFGEAKTREEPPAPAPPAPEAEAREGPGTGG
jgi:HAE1 family hydrophobic/amphiphilic exporter-1